MGRHQRDSWSSLMLGLALCSQAHAFMCRAPSTQRAGKLCASRHDGAADRRDVLAGLAGAAVSLGLVMQTKPKPALAEVAFDLERYGDKELKIATVNKLRQKLRNVVNQNPNLAVPFLRIAINDAVGYDAETLTGGPDGSVLFEMDQPQNAGLKEGMTALIKIKQEVQQTNELSLADIVAFAGAEAIETVGGPRIAVQIGRYDAKEENPNAGAAGYGWDELSGAGIKERMVKAGLGAREGTLLYGAVGAVHLAVEDANKAKSDSEEEGDFLEEQPFIPSTFGSSSAIYGETLPGAKFDVTYLAQVMKGNKSGLPVDSAIMGEDQMRSFVKKYSTNNGAFLKDLSEAYQKLTTLGYVGTTRNS